MAREAGQSMRQAHTRYGSGLAIRPAVALAAALAIIMAVYSRSIDAPFIWDDLPLIKNEPAAHDLRPAAHFFGTFWRATPGDAATPTYYRPLTTWSYALDWTRGGGDPASFHLTNLVLHLAACALVFALAIRLGASSLGAAAAASLFGLFPRLTECVSWISGRTDVLAATLALAALLLHSREDRSRLRMVGSAALILGGLLAKEVAAAAAVAIAARELAGTRTKTELKIRLNRLVPLAAVLALYAGLRWNALHDIPVPPRDPDALTPAQIPLAAAEALGRYALMLLDPLRPVLQIGLLGKPQYAVATLGALIWICGLVGLAWAIRAKAWQRADPDLAALAALGGSAIALVLHIVPFRVNIVAADRFLYVPVAALAVAGAVLVRRASPRIQRLATLLSLAYIAAFCAATYVRTGDWRDEIVLWKKGVATAHPANSLPAVELGNALRRAGRLEEALAQYRSVIPSPKMRARAAPIPNAAITLADMGRLDEAVAEMRAIISSGCGTALEHFNLGVMEAKRLNFEVALAEFDEASRLFPGYEDAARGRHLTEQARHDWEELPPQTDSEPISVAARRARVLGRVGADHQAARLWSTVVQSDAASRQDVLEASSFFVSRRRVAEAKQCIDALERVGLRAEAEALRAHLSKQVSG